MELTLVSVYLTHLLLQLQLAEMDYREAESRDMATREGRDVVEQRGEKVVECLRSVCKTGKSIIIHMNGRSEMPHTLRGVDSLCERNLLVYRPLDNESLTLDTCDLMLASRIEVPELGEPDSRFMEEAAVHGRTENE